MVEGHICTWGLMNISSNCCLCSAIWHQWPGYTPLYSAQMMTFCCWLPLQLHRELDSLRSPWVEPRLKGVSSRGFVRQALATHLMVAFCVSLSIGFHAICRLRPLWHFIMSELLSVLQYNTAAALSLSQLLLPASLLGWLQLSVDDLSGHICTCSALLTRHQGVRPSVLEFQHLGICLCPCTTRSLGYVYCKSVAK